MAHSIEVLLDADSDQAIRGQWQTLAEAGLPSQMRVKSPTNRPHITLLAAPKISPGVDEALRGLAGSLPFECVIGAPVVFGAGKHTLARLVVPSAALLAVHAEVYRLSCPHVTGDPYPHCAPGHWTPHVTLGRRLTEAEVGAALEALGDPGEPTARIVGLRRWDSDQRIDHILIG